MSLLDNLRAEFPLLQNHAELIFLDSAASTQKPRCVIDSLVHTYSQRYANVHRGIYRLSNETTDAYEAVREQLRAFLNAKSNEEIIFVRGATEGINLIAHSFAANQLHAGDEILVSALEHHANLIPWQQVANATGAKIKVIPLTISGHFDTSKIGELINANTKILALSHCSNVLGTVSDLQPWITAAHQVGARVLLDGAQAAAHIPVDLQKLNCDFYVCSAHKMYGPTGIGAVYCKKELWPLLTPYQTGGNMISSVSYTQSKFLQPPHLFEAGTPNIADTIAWGATLKFLAQIDQAELIAAEHSLMLDCINMLNDFQGIRVLSAPDVPVISFVHDAIHAHDIGTILDGSNIAVRSGHHCAMPLMQTLGIPACVRASFGMYNRHTDIQALAQGLQQVYDIMGIQRGRK
jgi:cysteine desulfurase/selenocysteine lyase